MKKVLLVFILFIVFTTKTNAQDYIPMAVENAQWVIYIGDDDGYPPFNEYHYGYRIEGDTIINGLTYKKVYRRDFETINPDLGNPLVDPFVAVNETLFGAIRDDIPNKKVYGIQFCVESLPNSCVCDEEFLMYDFSMNINDNFDEALCLHESFGFFVGNITNEFILDSNRLVQHIHGYIGDTYLRIYEGVGSSAGLFEPIGIPLGCPCGSLSNYCVGNDQECLEGFILNTNKQNINTAIKIYPNPVTDVLNVEILDEKLKKITIYTLLGKEIITTNTNKIDIAKLNNGVYFIKITTNNNDIIIKKFIKN